MIHGKLFVKHNLFVKLLALYFISLVLGALNIGPIGSLLKIIAFLPFFWWLCSKHVVTLNRPVMAAFFFLSFTIASVLWSIYPAATCVGMINSISLLLLLLASSGYHYTKDDLIFLKKALVWSSRITAITLLIMGAHYENRLTLGGVLNEDPNYLCSYYLFGIANAVECILSTQKHTHKLMHLLELAVYVGLVLATGSRGGTLAVVICIGVAGVGCLLKNRISIKTIILPIILVGALAIICVVLPYLLPKSVLERFYVQEIIDSKGTGRYRIWHDYWCIFLDTSLWRQAIGYGFKTLPKLAEQQRLVGFFVAHNIFVEHLLGLGVLGLGLYINFIWQFLCVIIRQRQIFSIAVLIGLIVLTMSTSFNGKVYFNILIYIVCCSKIAQDAKGEND